MFNRAGTVGTVRARVGILHLTLSIVPSAKGRDTPYFPEMTLS